MTTTIMTEEQIEAGIQEAMNTFDKTEVHAPPYHAINEVFDRAGGNKPGGTFFGLAAVHTLGKMHGAQEQKSVPMADTTTKGNGDGMDGFNEDFAEFIASRVDHVPLRYERDNLDRAIAAGSSKDISDAITGLVCNATVQAYRSGYRDGVRTIIHSLSK